MNPSGGLISKGHPLGATGLAQCAEMCWQLRNEAGKRQVANAKLAMSHNLGLGGAVVVTIYKRPEAWTSIPMKRKSSGGSGFAEDYPEGAKGAPTAGAGAGAGAGASAAAANPAATMFTELGALLKSNPDIVKRVGAVYKFDITGAGVWTVDLKNGAGSVVEGEGGKPDCTFTTNTDNFVALMSGTANAQKLFMSGKLKVRAPCLTRVWWHSPRRRSLTVTTSRVVAAEGQHGQGDEAGRAPQAQVEAVVA